MGGHVSVGYRCNRPGFMVVYLFMVVVCTAVMHPAVVNIPRTPGDRTASLVCCGVCGTSCTLTCYCCRQPRASQSYVRIWRAAVHSFPQVGAAYCESGVLLQRAFCQKPMRRCLLLGTFVNRCARMCTFGVPFVYRCFPWTYERG